ncbi:hypothetical protein [Streptomyces sp. NPDC046862]|uniref:hypothetical protein n=1 Tax=Streptomyces sp. NPDC046862 TaxID=3154603 RepID=UPI0034530BC2
MLASLSDWIIAVAAGLVMYAAAFYALCLHIKSVRRRRHGSRPAEMNPVYQRRLELEARLVREQHVARHAERIVAAELGRVGGLYEEPTRGHANH